MNEALQELNELKALKRTVNFAMIPYIVDDMPLSVYAKALYLHIVRRTGASENGRCFETVENMAKILNISKNTVTKSKRELESAGLINIVKNTNPDNKFVSDVISLVDIQLENAYFYSEYLDPDDRKRNNENLGTNLLVALKYHLKEKIDELESLVSDAT